MFAYRGLKLLVDAAVAYDQQPVANGEQFLEFRRNDDDANPAARQIYQDTVDLLPGADVDPPCWLIANQHLGAAQQCAREQGFLLVAAAKHADRSIKRSRDKLQAVKYFRGRAPLVFGAHDAGAREFAECASGRVCQDTKVSEQPVGLAVLSEIDNSVCNRRARRGPRDVLAADARRYPRSRLEAGERPGEVRAAGAKHSRETQDLAGPDREILAARSCRYARFKQRRAGSSDLRQLEPLTHAVSDNETDQFAMRQGRYRLGGDVPAVPQHRYAVGKRKHLLEAMGHVDDEQAGALEATDDAEQHLLLGV